MVNILLIGRLFYFLLIIYLIETLHEAREKVKLAEDTSDLSNIENSKRKKKTAINLEPPQYIEKLHENKQNGKYLLNVYYLYI